MTGHCDIVSEGGSSALGDSGPLIPDDVKGWGDLLFLDCSRPPVTKPSESKQLWQFLHSQAQFPAAQEDYIPHLLVEPPGGASRYSLNSFKLPPEQRPQEGQTHKELTDSTRLGETGSLKNKHL